MSYPSNLSSEQRTSLQNALNGLLSSYQTFYMNVRGFHWNIRGPQFFALHVKFEELYTDFQLKIDELAERILTLGGQPLHSFVDYLERSRIAPVVGATSAEATVGGVLSALETLLQQQREVLSLAAEASDEGTVSILSEYIKEQEKLVWMYSAYMG
ncbi:MAG: Dps family protein [Candidatus Sericytochromatia bacterium]